MISRYLFSLLFFIAGMTHVFFPQVFDPAIAFFPYRDFINGLVGCLEVLLALSLWHSKLQDYAAQACALWLLILFPIHVYVSWNKIEIFGISHPILLWGRTGFQFVFYFWALSLQKNGWLMSQRWSNVLFLHYEVDADKLQNRVPYPLDLYQGKAIISIVPFRMSRIRFPFLPPLPGLSSLYELNLRTYVRVNGRALVYFFTLDSNHALGVLIAKIFFALPYRWKSMRLSCRERYNFTSQDFSVSAHIHNQCTNSDFDRWCTERYGLITQKKEIHYLGEVQHRPWELKLASMSTIEDNFSTLIGEEFKATQFLSPSYCSKIDVRFKPFKKHLN